MNKTELATALAACLNLLNDIREGQDALTIGRIDDIIATIPRKILGETDYFNNGTVEGSDLL
jgi:hypothetical protein